MPKDLFSKQSKLYAKYRPKYPKKIYEAIYNLLIKYEIPFHTAWDCATGNGQVAFELSKKFNQVYASDISSNQIKFARSKDNIFYLVEPAEQSSIDKDSINLITVAQGLHWFSTKKFFKEVKRVSKKPAILAVWCYATCKFNDPYINEIFIKFYKEILKNYWESERKLVETGYATIQFPFIEIQNTQFEYETFFTKKQFLGYVNSWSSVVKFKDIHSFNPVFLLKDFLNPFWKEHQRKKIVFPLYLKNFLID